MLCRCSHLPLSWGSTSSWSIDWSVRYGEVGGGGKGASVGWREGVFPSSAELGYRVGGGELI